MLEPSDVLHHKPNDLSFLSQVHQKLGTKPLVLDPFVCTGFGLKVRYFIRESSKFDYNGYVELRRVGFVYVGPEFVPHIKAQVVNLEQMPEV